jgi:hypothetical protein
MMPEVTNLLLITLIGLIAYIGKSAYEKINEILSIIKQISINHQKHDSEITELKATSDDHEQRLRKGNL